MKRKTIKKIYKKFNFIFRWFDPLIDLRKLIFSIPNYLRFFVDLGKYIRKDNRYSLKIKDIYPCIHDKSKFTGFDRHYIYHPAWAARILKETKPDFHIDISSSLHFCSIVSAFIPVKFYDFRPAKLNLSNLTSEHADLVNLPFESNSIQSLSCMHTIEHVGLGRYGDPIDPDGDLKAISELKRVLGPNGNLLFVVPVGKPKIMYNAHRIYSYDEVFEYFKDLVLNKFSLVPDDKELGFINNATKEIADVQNYGCGCFWFKKNIGI
jgi:SAM-dependent methyltransferase